MLGYNERTTNLLAVWKSLKFKPVFISFLFKKLEKYVVGFWI